MALTSIQWAAIRFLTVPNAERGMTEKEWATAYMAQEGDPPDRAWERLRGWYKQHKEFKAQLEKSKSHYEADPNYADRIARGRARDVLLQGLMDATDSESRRKHAKDVMHATKDLEDILPASDFSTYSDAELIAFKLGIAVDVCGISNDELKDILELLAEEGA